MADSLSSTEREVPGAVPACGPDGLLRQARTAAIVLLPVLAGVFRGALFLYPGQVWFDYGFKVFLAGTVGIWTNYFAIRMLFRPRERTVFGRQGLIPARREELTAAIASAVARELLDPETVRAYIEENDLVGKSAGRVLAVARAWMARPANRQKAVVWAARLIRNQGEEQLNRWLPRLTDNVFKYLDAKVSAETVWPLAERALRRELDKPESRQAATRVIVTLVDENSEEIAALFNRMIDDWIREKKGFSQAALAVGKIALKVDEFYIRRELRRIVSRRGFFNQVLKLVDDNIPALVRIGEDPEFRRRLASLIEEQKGALEEWLKSEGAALARDRILAFLESEEFWTRLDLWAADLAGRFESYARERIESEEFRALSSRYLIRTIRKLDVGAMVRGRISDFDIARLEALIRKVTGENLCGIELFGGILGMLAGLVLISPLWAAGIAAAAAAFLLVERAFSRRRIPPAPDLAGIGT